MDGRLGALLGLAVCAAVACGGADRTVKEPRRSARSVRTTMAALHRSGGVPPRWRFTPPPGDPEAGRTAFQRFRCHTCHTVQGEVFSVATTIGPELTGMGGHHPPEYFAESILNPDAVLVEGPGYIGPDGRSTMPWYPYLSVQQVADLTAYLSSLKAPGDGAAGGAVDHAAMGHGPIAASEPEPTVALPAPPADEARSFFVQVYDVQPDRLAAFEEWFQAEGAPAFFAHDGLLRIDTFVDLTRDGPALSSVFAFRDDEARDRFLLDSRVEVLGYRFDEYIGPHPHRAFGRSPLYRAESLSATAPARPDGR